MTTVRGTTRTRRRNAPAPGRCQGDEGSILLELAFVAPVLIMMLLGVFEFGTIYRNQAILASALRGGARIESQIPQQMTAGSSVDEQAIRTFYAGVTQMRNMALQRVIVYDASANGTVPAACKSVDVTSSPLNPHGLPSPITTAQMQAPSSGAAGYTSCNVYSLQQVQHIVLGVSPSTAYTRAGNGDCVTGNTGNWDQFYCPKYRNNSVGSPDLIGLYAQYTYTQMTKLLPTSTMTISDTAIYTAQPSV